MAAPFLRLSAAHPPLWRTEHDLQLGPDAVATLHRPLPWQERIVDALERGLPASAMGGLALEHDVAQADVRALLTRIDGALTPRAPDTQWTVLVRHLDGLPGADGVTAGASAAGAEVRDDIEREVDATAHILVSHHCPDLAAARRSMAADVPHIPVVLRGEAAEVGPLVIPGHTPCLMCVDDGRTLRDEAWPNVRAQLTLRAPTTVVDPLAHEAGFLAARLLAEGPTDASRSVLLTWRSTRRRWRTHAVSPDCACRSL